MIRIKHGKVIEIGLPENGFLSDGSAVSNYHCLSEDILKKEGWVRPKEVIPPLKDDEELGEAKYELRNRKWIKTYEVVKKSEVLLANNLEEQDIIEELQERIKALESLIVD